MNDVATDVAEAPKGAEAPLSNEACQRIWEHALHEENVFSDRLNFFLIAEAMLLVFHAEVMGKVDDRALVLIGVFGVIITIAWLLINRRQIGDLKDTVGAAEQCLPDYARRVREARQKGGLLRRSAAPILGYFIPFVIILIWTALIVDAAMKVNAFGG